MLYTVPTTQHPTRYSLYRTAQKEVFLLLDRERAPKLGDLVITNSGEPKLAHYRGQPILGVATLLKCYQQFFLWLITLLPIFGLA